MIKKSCSLHCTEPTKAGGRSDKVYHIQLIEHSKTEYTVQFQYGRRGKTLTWGTKTEDTMNFWDANKIFEKKIQHEKKKGYVIIPDPDDLMMIVGLTF